MTSSKNKIIFFINSPFNERDYDRFGIEILKKNRFEVEVWDFTPFLSPKVFKNYIPPDKSNFEKCYIFFTEREAISAINKLPKSCLIICMFSYNYNTYTVYRTLSKNRLEYCIFNYAFPSYTLSNRQNLFKKLMNITHEKLLDHLFMFIPFKFLGIRPATMALLLGERINVSKLPINQTTYIIRSHHLDYDIYLKEIQNPIQATENICVFLDGYIPFHPDFLHKGASYLTPPEEYYQLLCNFFDFIEKSYGVHVIIAANPRSNYENHPDYFGGRPVIRGKTAELVKKSKFVILHETGAINFPVLFNKPMIFITTDMLRQSQIGPLIDFMASLFDKEAINLNNTFKIDWERELTVNEEAYWEYKNSYIKKDGTKETSVWQTLVNYLKSSN
ncbi:hypothetical protein A45J_2367 [hot springs metagenome]|uniref:Glycosyltransferase family 1 protein n=1 Tax=hot springs metagenome TaxID=433727 RepID=A0A5J4L4I4_9ZZZZ